MGDTTPKPKRGRQPPWGHVTRQRASTASPCGFARVVCVTRWNSVRLPSALATRDPERQGHQPSLCRQRLKAYEPPAWGREGVVGTEAGEPAQATLQLIAALPWP